uniref:Fungal lipase-type domain-containing protein n=1 Tax=Salix viminalis TaxID=40686 RepID=A0A6N2L2Y9_SALVM
MEMSPFRQVTTDETRSRKNRRSWRLKLNITWHAIKKRFHLHLRLSCARSMRRLSTSQTHQELTVKPHQASKQKKRAKNPNKTLATLLHVPYTAMDFVDQGDHMTPTLSPKQSISAMWKEIHGSSNWETLLDPLHSSLRREILKYGEFVQATYDAFDFDPLSEFCGSCRYNRRKLFETLGLTKHGYKVRKYIYALSHVDVPDWLKRSCATWSRDSNWMGYVAVSRKEESQRIGRRDIMVAWRGTVSPSEWFKDLTTSLEHIDSTNVKVQEGKGEEVSLTVTGHSLGGALALLNAYEAATVIPDLFVSVISFGAPRVGNIAFKEKLGELGVNTLRVVVKQDIVPKLPGLMNKMLNKFHGFTGKLNWVYRHVGTQLKLDAFMSPYLKPESDLSGSHNLELYLHLIDGFLSKKSKYRWNARRDLALVNKGSDMLIEDLKIPEFWYQFPYKGLMLNQYGRMG